MGLYETYNPLTSGRTKDDKQRQGQFRYPDGSIIEIGDACTVADHPEWGTAKVRMKDLRGIRVVVSNQTCGAQKVEPHDLRKL
jgi:hypothetical protein